VGVLQRKILDASLGFAAGVCICLLFFTVSYAHA
jgi:hypothetical protein